MNHVHELEEGVDPQSGEIVGEDEHSDLGLHVLPDAHLAVGELPLDVQPVRVAAVAVALLFAVVHVVPGHDLPVAVHDVPQRPAEIDEARQHAVLRDAAAEVRVLLLAELLLLE